jgi:hypothetical protein
MAERRSVRSTRHDDDYEDEFADDELAGSADDELADRDAGLTAAHAARAAQRQIAELTGRQPEGVTGVEPTEDGWVVGIEVVEDRRIPPRPTSSPLTKPHWTWTGNCCPTAG